MSKDTDKKTVIQILQNLGFSASEIPEEPQKGRRADIRASKNDQYYLIEVKSREDHPEFTTALKKSNDLEVVPYQKHLRKSNTIGKIVREGVRQLQATPDRYQSFKCIWFRAIETLLSDAFDFVKATLYGTRYLLVRDQSGNISYAICYYFDPNEFFKYTSLDAVILDNGRSAELSVNSYSKRFTEFRGCVLYQLFDSQHALTDPLRLEEKKEILVADTDIPRSDAEAVIEFVQRKYNIYVNPVEMKSMGAAILYAPE
jgi:hypothetical protein